MIELKHVSKRYGAVEAVRDVSFSAPKGQIVGLLGQNGAGKTTTLNMLTGYFPPTSGQVLVNGMDMLRNPRDCKRHIGYLPEKLPLYDEMTVNEYLTFVCRLREVEKHAIKNHIDDIVALCGLEEMRNRLLGRLSKGYRQRVGLAQALCGDPETLVLDEPTVGLDPKQVVEIRDLIRRLGENHTILFSSHILSEIQQLCSRAVILHRGSMVREIDLGRMEDGCETLRLRASIAMEGKRLVPALKSLPCVRRVRVFSGADAGVTEAELECENTPRGNAQAQLFRLLCGLDAPILALVPMMDTLEEVFLRVTSGESGGMNA